MSNRNYKEIIGFSFVLLLAIIVVGANLVILPKEVNLGVSFSTALWEYRGLDVLGQALILIAGAFSVVALLRDDRSHE
jgi:hypothetical protein